MIKTFIFRSCGSSEKSKQARKEDEVPLLRQWLMRQEVPVM